MASSIPIQFRVATPDDAVQIAQLVQAAFRADDSRESWTADVELNRSFTMKPEEALATINNPNAAFLMAITNDDTLIGAIATIKRSKELARFAMLAVDQTYQRNGLGRRVLEHAEEYAQKTWGVKKLGLNALNTRELLIGWYERRGYVRTGEKSPFPVEAFKNLDLPRDLHFVEMEKEAGGEQGV
ncbi:hypothetical protein N0V90_007595 [Kalmusia sp. IMI 367209]|nr:hypothetical protein N0V90_007595 [Kalmusia sp. IMI 367209]